MEKTRYKSEITGEIEKVTFRNDETGWTVARFREKAGISSVTTTGHFTNIRPGESYHLVGFWTKHPQYGKQFQVERSVPIRPTTKEGIKKYLASGVIKGVGLKTADKIVEKFGIDTLDILDKHPERIKQVDSIGKSKALTITKAWQEQKQDSEINMFLNQYGLTGKMAQRICNLYGSDAIRVISSDPYRLSMEISGVGFVLADQLAQRIGIPPDDPARFRAAVIYQLQQAEDRGHCFLSKEQLSNGLQETLRLPVQDVTEPLSEAINYLDRRSAILKERAEVLGQGETDVFFTRDLFLAETNVAHIITRQLSERVLIDQGRVERWLAKYVQAAGLALSEDQKDAVRLAARTRVFILTGGPGTGKTTASNAIIRLFKAMGKEVVLAAPTGRAAQRLSEVTGEEAKTIHRLLEWNPATRKFGCDEENPIEADVLVVDESSMIDIRLMDALLRAISASTHVVFIGDADQLPSVGPGNVLRDFIDSRQVPVKRLQEVFRQAATSSIIQTAHQINKGLLPNFEHGERRDERKDCWFLEIEDPLEMKKSIFNLLADTLPQKFGLDPLKDIQLLTPMNRGVLGTIQLNRELQAILNPDQTGKTKAVDENERVALRPGDKVIQCVNNYDLGIFNGDIGFVRQAGISGGKIQVAFGSRLILFDQEELQDLHLAYAITIHKSQGSEFPAVIIPVSMQHYIMLLRNLFYTALTRAKKLAIFVGTRKALAYAIRNERTLFRQTNLRVRLMKELSGEYWVDREILE